MLRMNKIMQNVITYGTSIRLLSKKRGLDRVRDFMIPEYNLHKTLREEKFRSRGDFLMMDPVGKIK